MSKLHVALVCAAVAVQLLGQQTVFAQADAKFKGNYNFWQAQGWQQQAQTQARSLYYYGQTQAPTPAQAREHATTTRTAVASCQKSLAELKKENPDNKEAQAAIAKIEQIQKKVLGHCDMCDKALAKADHVAMCACCADIVHDLDEANAEMAKLKKALKISDEIPKRK